MKILINIGHPGHVHLFKNFIQIMRKRGHEIAVLAKNKEVAYSLLRFYRIPFKPISKHGKGISLKLIYYGIRWLRVLNAFLKFRPDVAIGVASPHIAQLGWLLQVPTIIFDDTEHSVFEIALYKPFASAILTPFPFLSALGSKHLRYDGYHELAYLHPNYFTSDPSILDLLGVKKDEKYIIMRFVSWNASHDIGHSGLSLEMKKKAAKELSKYARVFISSEGELPEDLKQYQIKTPPERIHDALAFATLFVGEGATMASECAMLGTPAIYVNSLTAGTLEEQENYGLIFGYRNADGVLEKALELLRKPNLKQEWQKRREKMLSDKINVTAFMVWFIENYPDSVKIAKEDPNFQLRFR